MRDFVEDALVYLVGRAIPAVVGIASVWLFVRLLGEAGYGSYAVLLSGSNLVSVVVVGWLSQSILRYQATVTDTHPFALSVALGLAAAALAAIPASATITWLSDVGPDIKTAAWSACLLSVGLSVHASYAASLQAALRARAVAVLEVSRAIVALPICVLGILTIEPPYVGALLGVGISYALSGMLSYRLSYQTMPHGAGRRAALASARRFLVFGWPISCWLGVSLLFPFAERVLIQRILGAPATGEYAAMYDLVYRSCGFVLLPIVLAAHPRIMREHGRNSAREVYRLWRTGLLLQLVVAGGLTAGLAVVAPWIAEIAGLSITGAAPQLVVPLAAAGCIWQMALIAQKLLEAHQRTRLMLALLIAALTLNVALDIATLPRFGVMAAAYSLLFCGVVYTIGVSLAGLRLGTPSRDTDQNQLG